MFLISCLLAGTVAIAAPTLPNQDEMISGLNTIQQVFNTSYAMQGWKKSHLNFDMAKAFDQARLEVNANPAMTLKQYQRVVKRVLSDMNDYHVQIHFQRTEQAVLPLTIRSADGKYFIASINRVKLSQSTFPFKIGDEVLEFAGRPIAEEIKNIREIDYGGVEDTDQALAELTLTSRKAIGGMDVPKGPVMLKFRMQSDGSIREHQLIWTYTPEIVHPTVPAALQADETKPSFEAFNKKFVFGGWSVDRKPREEDPIGDIGTRKSYVPELGAKIWESDDKANYHAYIFRAPNNSIIGYVRIPHYMGNGNWIAEFAQLISRMEKTTDALVIDEINNPGGSLFYLYALTSLLTKQPLFTPQEQMKITATDVMEYLSAREQMKNISSDAEAKEALSKDFDGLPVSMQTVEFMRNFIQFILDEWTAGRTLTNPYYIGGVDRVNPYPGDTYSKPILLLVNQLCFSGGDFFPAILQDNKRVTVFGTRTAGAGGYVTPTKFANRLGIDAFSVTGSIARRVNDNPIENLGVTPDINYELTAEDFTTNFTPYKHAILKALDGKIK